MDNRDLKELHVNWQFTLFFVALILLPLAMIPIGVAYINHEEIRNGVINFTAISVALLSFLILISLWSRIRQVRGEMQRNGKPVCRLIVQQIIVGLSLLIFGACLTAAVAWVWPGIPRKLSCLAGMPVGLPGLTMMARAMIPKRD